MGADQVRAAAPLQVLVQLEPRFDGSQWSLSRVTRDRCYDF
jgi:hypothetical protein